MPRVLGGSQGVGRFLMSEVPLYLATLWRSNLTKWSNAKMVNRPLWRARVLSRQASYPVLRRAHLFFRSSTRGGPVLARDFFCPEIVPRHAFPSLKGAFSSLEADPSETPEAGSSLSRGGKAGPSQPRGGPVLEIFWSFFSFSVAPGGALVDRLEAHLRLVEGFQLTGVPRS